MATRKPLTPAQKRRAKQQAKERYEAQKLIKAEKARIAKLEADPDWKAEMSRRSKAEPGSTLRSYRNRRDHYTDPE
jgi:hypothetical protein